MITLEISTHSGGTDIVEVEEYNVEDVVEQLNDNEIMAIAFGDNIYSRIDIKNIRVIEDEAE